MSLSPVWRERCLAKSTVPLFAQSCRAGSDGKMGLEEERVQVSFAARGRAIFGNEEMEAVASCLERGELIGGDTTKQFESRVADLFGRRFGVMVNSGSSANLLALEEVPDGSAVATPVLTFPTTISYLMERTRIYFVDVEPHTFQIDFEAVPAEVDALVVPNLFGNLPDWSTAPATEFVVEDSCDTLPVDISRPSDVVTTSFYASHIITACGAGGMVMTDDVEMAERFRSKREWGRSTTSTTSSRFRDVGGVRFDVKCIYERPGYNFQPLALQAAFALVQLETLRQNLERRRRNVKILSEMFTNWAEEFTVPTSRLGANWMAFPVLLRSEQRREDFALFLEERGVETRPLFAGNILRQPAFQDLTLAPRFPNADRAMRTGLLIGCHQALRDIHLEYVGDCVEAFLSQGSESLGKANEG